MVSRGGICAGLASAMIACATLSAFAPAAAVAEARILYFESLPQLAPQASAAGVQKTTHHHLQFDAYGKRFELSLEENARLSTLLQSKADASPSVKLYRGSLTDIPGSWVRLATRDGEVRGMIWDGSELYAIENANDVASSLVAPLEVGSSGTVIFRLSDTLLDSGTTFCSADGAAEAQKGADAYDALVSELKSGVVMMRAAGATMRIELSVLADAAFRNSRTSDQQAQDDILLRLNNVDGIFSSQLEVEVQVPSIDVRGSGNDPFSGTSSASTLLSELGKVRKQSSQLRSRGLTHLFTGRDLDGSTVGIAYLDSLCHAEYGAGLTEVTTRGAWIESLVTAHEIGHNFGAEHDGQGACASTSQNLFLMSPSVSSTTSTFSQCSVTTMRSRIASAACIAELPAPDLSVPQQLQTLHRAVGRPFDWELAVTNIGGSTAQNARIEITIPPVLKIEDAYVPGGTCVSGAGIIFCSMGEIAGGANRIVHLTLSSETVGSSSVSATVAANTEAQASNNTGTGTIAIDSESDIAITLQAPSSVTAATSFQGRYTVSNLSTREASNIVVTVDLPGDLSATAFSLPSATCTQRSGAVECSLPSLAAGAIADGTITLMAQTSGSGNLRARVAGTSYIDPVSENDSAERTIVVTSAAATIQSSAPSSGGGGGGSSSLGLLLALGALSRRKKRIADRG